MATQTPQDVLDYYGALLIKQYVSQLNAKASVEMVCSMPLMPQNYGFQTSGGNLVRDADNNILLTDNVSPLLPFAVEQAFSLDTAVGVQLDVLGKYVSISRTGAVFSGVIVTLDDNNFRLLVKAALARNSLKASLADIQQFIFTYLNGIVQVYDLLYMHMSYVYLATVGTIPWAELFIKAHLLPRPLAVQGGPLIHLPGTPIFGFRTYSHVGTPITAGFGTYSTPLPGFVLRYSDEIPV